MGKMSRYNLFAQRTGLVAATQFMLNLSAIILLPVLTKNLSIQDYGVWAQIAVTIGLVPEILVLGLQTSMIRYFPSIMKKDIQGIFYSFLIIILISSSIGSVIVYKLSSKIAFELFNGELFVIQLLSLLVFLESIQKFFLHYFRGTQQIKKHSIFSLIQIFLKLSFVTFFVLTGKGIVGATLGYLISSFLSMLITGLFVISNIGLARPIFSNLQEYLFYGLPNVPGRLSNWMVNSGDRYLIGIFLGVTYVGYYSPGYTLGWILVMFSAPLNFMLPMALSKFYDEDDLRGVRLLLSYSLKYFLMLEIPSVFGLSLLSKSLLNIMSTSEIASEGYIITPLVAISALIYGVYIVFQKTLLLEKKTQIIGGIWMISAMLNLFLNVVLIPYFGIIAAAITTIFSFGLSLLVVIYFSRKHLKFDTNPKFIGKCVLSSILMSLLIVNLNPVGLLNVFFTVLLCALVYFAVLFILKGFEDKEIIYFKKLLKTTH